MGKKTLSAYIYKLVCSQFVAKNNASNEVKHGYLGVN